MTNLHSYRFSLQDIDFDPANIECFMGYQPGDAPEPIPGLIEEIHAELQKRISIRGGFLVVDKPLVNQQEQTIECAGAVFSTGKIVTGMLRKAKKCAFFICTAGEGIQTWAAECNREGDILRAYVIDVFGSELAEAGAEKMHTLIGAEAGNYGMKVSNRYSPGYCGWPVHDQQVLFSLFPENYCDITLSPSSLMDPIKSVSGIIGLGPEMKRQPYTCHLCGDKNCIYRNLRQKSIHPSS